MGIFDFLTRNRNEVPAPAKPAPTVPVTVQPPAIQQPLPPAGQPVLPSAVQPATPQTTPVIPVARVTAPDLRSTGGIRVPLGADASASEEYRLQEERRLSEPRVQAQAGLKVLVIDDSPTVVALLSRMLKQNHFQPIEAYDAEQGIELAKLHQPALIFLDIVLPGMNGFTALRTLRREPLTHLIPIIMISGNQQATEEFYVQRIGAQDFMKKPFSRAEVFARIERLLGKELIPKRLESAA